MVAVDPVSLRDIPQDFAKLYIQHELLSSRARQQGMSYIIENYTLSQKKQDPYTNVNNLRTEVPIHSPFGTTIGLPI